MNFLKNLGILLNQLNYLGTFQPVLQKDYGQPSILDFFFWSPNPLRVKPICYGALRGHLKGLSLCLVLFIVGPFLSYGRCGLV